MTLFETKVSKFIDGDFYEMETDGGIRESSLFTENANRNFRSFSFNFRFLFLYFLLICKIQ